MRYPRHASSDHAPATAEDLRQWGRYATGEVDILIPTDRDVLPGVVVDESIGGIGIRLNEMPALTMGQALQLEYHGEVMPGYVTSLREHQDNFRLGICWTDAPEAMARFRYAASFFEFKGLSVVCQVVDTTPSETASVVMWDGTAFHVPADRLRYRTVRHRKSELLQSPESISMLAGLYKLGELSAGAADVEKVLDLEYSDLRTREDA